MAGQSNAAPVIIKRKKVVAAEGHHGGAWKVAYADFVTAMMAFFLLMWLLNATTEQQRKGLADYFSPDIPISRVSGGGDGAFGGESPFSEDTQTRNGTGATDHSPSAARLAQGRFGVALEQKDLPSPQELKKIEEALNGRGGESFVSEEMAKHIITRVTDEGLIIELFSTPDARLFEAGTARPTRLMRDLTLAVTRAAKYTTSKVAIGGFIRSRPVVQVDQSVWPISAKRATVTRELLEQWNLQPARIKRVTGHADRNPADENPMAIRNNRVTVTLLRKEK
ncbi:MAG: flagellar motor protein MotB [Paracoccaceae bacterium]